MRLRPQTGAALLIVAVLAVPRLIRAGGDAEFEGPYLVKDVNATPNPQLSSEPDSFVQVGGALHFVAYTMETGRELWVTDATTEGTRLVKDIFPGPTTSDPRELTAVGGVLYFSADDGVHGRELWRSDGTAEGTRMVIDLPPTESPWGPVGLVDVSGELFYFDAGALGNYDLMKTDGTAAGTTAVAFVGFPPAATAVMENVLFFTWGGNSTLGRLWRSDGTPEGTVLMASFSRPITELAVLNEAIFFAAEASPELGIELWKTDGTSEGTAIVKDIGNGDWRISWPKELTVLEGTLFFTADDGIHGRELWKSDGTDVGTTLVRDIRTEGDGQVQGLTILNGALYFAANDGTNGLELWTSDGTEMGTHMVADLQEGGGSSYPKALTDVNGTLFFTTSTTRANSGCRLWKSDGTPRGTTPLFDVCFRGQLQNLAGLENTLILTGNDGLHGHELWTSDGTQAGTVLLKDILAGTLSSWPDALTGVGGTLYFRAVSDVEQNDSGTPYPELWKTEGTEKGTVRLRSWEPVNYSWDAGPEFLTSMGRTLFFTARERGTFSELWKTDGSPEGTVRVLDGVSVGSFGPYLTPLGSVLLFAAEDGVHGRELWRSDGTSAGTYMVKDIYPGGSALDSSPQELVAVGGNIFFSATGGPTQNRELWKSDGTPEGTVLIKDIRPGIEGSMPRGFVASRGKILFSAYDGTFGWRLWVSDGTEAGTYILEDLTGGSGPFLPRELTDVNGTVFFEAEDEAHGIELWKTDGTIEGTVLVKDLTPGPSSSNLSELRNVNGTLFFATHGWRSTSLWKSDGTEKGTARVRHFESVFGSEYIWEIVNVGGRAVFRRNDSSLWTSDGTEQGTLPIPDISVPSGAVGERMLGVGCEHLFVKADHPVFGREVFALNFNDPDCDNVEESIDNCPGLSNHDQLDCDGDGLGDACDAIFPGDMNGNGSMDLADLRFLTDCLGGSGRAPAPAKYGCDVACTQAFDFTGGGTIDLRDYAQFQARYPGD